MYAGLIGSQHRQAYAVKPSVKTLRRNQFTTKVSTQARSTCPLFHGWAF